ncbi:MAG: tryptophan synthase subunit alpha [Nitrospira bacterium HGW-Nitrospira-1]|nr:MAG: tryptophan synthase subunit alpha [Nitrospira bacterium HGW-Nitrospira-1]
MSSRIAGKFREIRRKNSKAFIPYIMAGDPNIKRTCELIRILEDCGADIIELGVPFSDPLADGPTIQKAAQRALDEGVTLKKVIALVAELRLNTQIPIILMTYYNPIFKYGEERFALDASASGVDGIIVPDLPPDEADNLIKYSRKSRLDTIFLLAPTSTDIRIHKVARASTGFIYYVPITGITGAKLSPDSSVESHIAKIRSVTDKPIAVGFGISTPEEAAGISRFADGVIVGSAIVKRVVEPDEELKNYLLSLRNAIQ